MAGVNKVILLGNLGGDPEVKEVGNGKVANFTLATSEKWKNKEGNPQEATEWHNIEVWGKLADIAQQYLKKGSTIFLEGKIKTDSWEDDGKKRYKTKIRAVTFTMVGGKQANQGNHTAPMQSNAPKANTPANVAQANGADVDDLPF